MASLLQKVFDTMPLTGILGYGLGETGLASQITLGYVAGHLIFVDEPTQLMVDAPVPSDETISKASHGDIIPIWGWAADVSSPRVTGITCRVRDDAFKQYVVLEELAFGYTPNEQPTGWRDAVRIVHRGSPIELPLTERFRLMTFRTKSGRIPADEYWLFPLASRHDESLVHIYAYDILPVTHEPMGLRDEGHPQSGEIDDMLSRCLELNVATADDPRKLFDLFVDDLWQPQAEVELPGGLEGLAVATGVSVLAGATAEIATGPIRVLVACAMTCCKEQDDFVPGHLPLFKLVGMGRLYPHIMTVATVPLDRVDSGIRFTRPTETTIRDGEECGCGEMTKKIGSGLWTDSNAGDMMVDTTLVAPPPPFWSNIFNYYVCDPDQQPDLVKVPIQLVRRDAGAREDRGSVDRDYDYGTLDVHPENANRISKLPRQGAFDNIHLAPRMRVKATFDKVRVGDQSLAFTSLEDWKMDRIVMAPFCAHDCFHLHVRWGNSLTDEKPVLGWGELLPNVRSGAPMVPMNHDVYVVLLGPNAFTYLDEAWGAPADVWQVACYHGSAYALTASLIIDAAEDIVFEASKEHFSPMEPLHDWAMFYWHLRYRFEVDSDGQLAVFERLKLLDAERAIKL